LANCRWTGCTSTDATDDRTSNATYSPIQDQAGIGYLTIGVLAAGHSTDLKQGFCEWLGAIRSAIRSIRDSTPYWATDHDGESAQPRQVLKDVSRRHGHRPFVMLQSGCGHMGFSLIDPDLFLPKGPSFTYTTCGILELLEHEKRKRNHTRSTPTRSPVFGLCLFRGVILVGPGLLGEPRRGRQWPTG